MSSTQAIPSSSALWASMGPATQSPMEYTLGTDVRNFSSTTILFLSSVFTPTPSRLRLSVKGRRPMDTSTASAFNVLASPPATGSTWRDTESPLLVPPITFVPNMKFMPCFLSDLVKAVPTSLSRKGQILSPNSTTVTLEPKRRHTEPSSRPITPPPITIKFSGTLSRARAPVELTTVFSSKGRKGSSMGSEPVASMTFLVLITLVVLSLRVTSTSLLLRSFPKPFSYVTLFFLKRCSMPPVSDLTVFCLWSITFDRSKETPSQLMPCLEKVLLASSYIWEVWRRDFEGMHPTLRQVPPRDPLFSTQVTFMPS
mmetsp:Transcript_18839/g.47866  ORF Transcript_18839/g.47866 Transcript_18839/m.47866 type:complete len:313 (-) Transcript_18839:260-1198(-)